MIRYAKSVIGIFHLTWKLYDTIVLRKEVSSWALFILLTSLHKVTFTKGMIISLLQNAKFWDFDNLSRWGEVARKKLCFLRILFIKKVIQKLAKTWIYLTTYVCPERIFDSRPFMYNKILLKRLLQKLVAHIFTLLLAPFASKLVNYSRHGESLKNVWKW